MISLNFSEIKLLLAVQTSAGFMVVSIYFHTQVRRLRQYSVRVQRLLAWNPRKPLLAFSCDDKYERDRDGGAVKLFGISSES